MVNCLTVPDAFLAHQDYHTALSEYRRIGYAFPGRAEGREAMFRAGITLLEQARSSKTPEAADRYYDLALKELEKLHSTPGAPLENSGKALIYQAQKDYDEESKCFELAFRRYPNHPLLKVLQEQHFVHRDLADWRFRRGWLMVWQRAMSGQFRNEADSMGEVRVPADTYYGAQTGAGGGELPD